MVLEKNKTKNIADLNFLLNTCAFVEAQVFLLYNANI